MTRAPSGRSFAPALAVVLAAVGCSSKSSSKEVEPTPAEEPSRAATNPVGPVDAGVTPRGSLGPSSSSATPAVADGGVADIHGLADPRFMRLPLGGRLLVERTNRPANGLAADAVLDAVGSALGEKIGRRSQVPAWPWSAAYCEQGYTRLSVNILACEYRDAASLAKGREAAQKAAAAGGELVVVKSTSVAITASERTPDALAQVTTIAAAVKKL